MIFLREIEFFNIVNNRTIFDVANLPFLNVKLKIHPNEFLNFMMNSKMFGSTNLELRLEFRILTHHDEKSNCQNFMELKLGGKY